MDNKLPHKILEVLRNHYDEKPTGVLSTPEIANILKISVKDAQAGLIYLKEKYMINSYQDLDNKWVQKINAKGIDELNSTSNVDIENNNQDVQLRDNVQYAIKKFDQCISELDELGKPLTDFEKIIMPRYSINVNFSKIHEIYSRMKNLLKYAFVDGKQKSKQFVVDYDDFCSQKRYVRNSFNPEKEEEEKFRSQKYWLRSSAVEFLHELKIISELESLHSDSTKKIISTQSQSFSSDEKPLEFEASHEDHTGKIKVFISHKFVEPDQKLARTLQESLKKENIFSYVENRNRDYDLVWGEKIKRDIESSDYLVAIITKYSQNAPSIHQEMGYALGVKVPVRIMAEEQEAKGVLFEGKDVEKFSRDHFEKYLDNIIKDVLKKGFRKKISDKEKEELIKNVYRPCFNQMMNEYKIREFIVTIPSNKWKDLEPFWQLKTEQEIKNLFEEYSIELEKWHKTWIGFSNNFQNKRHELSQIIRQAFDKSRLLEGEMISLSDSKIAPQDWLDAFKFVLFDDKIEWDDQLYKILLDFSIKTKNGHQKWLEKWYEHKPDIFSSILELIPLLTKKLESPILLEQINNQRETLKMLIEKLTLQLEEKLK